MDTTPANIEIDKELYLLLKRCSSIEAREINDIVNSLLSPYLAKYKFNSIEEWESAREMLEIESNVLDFEKNDNFDPNHIPFDTQIMGLRRKLDDLDREISNSPTPDPALKELRFSLVKQLNFAEAETLKKQHDKRAEKIALWKRTCEQITLK
jgi:hypothetical protein